MPTRSATTTRERRCPSCAFALAIAGIVITLILTMLAADWPPASIPEPSPQEPAP